MSDKKAVSLPELLSIIGELTVENRILTYQIGNLQAELDKLKAATPAD